LAKLIAAETLCENRLEEAWVLSNVGFLSSLTYPEKFAKLEEKSELKCERGKEILQFSARMQTRMERK